MPSTAPPYWRLSPEAAAVWCARICWAAARVGTAPWRYGCPAAGEYGLMSAVLPAVFPAGAVTARAGLAAVSAPSVRAMLDNVARPARAARDGATPTLVRPLWHTQE